MAVDGRLGVWLRKNFVVASLGHSVTGHIVGRDRRENKVGAHE